MATPGDQMMTTPQGGVPQAQSGQMSAQPQTQPVPAGNAKEAGPPSVFAKVTGLDGLENISSWRQIGFIVGIAAAVALAVSLVLWSQDKEYSVLFSKLSPNDTSEIVNILSEENIDYQIEPKSGVLMVPDADLHEARILLAGKNLPSDNSVGFELIDKEEGFGTSSFLQTARYHRAMEGELARTIVSMEAVENARVHLALPKESAFIRDRRKPSASVMLNLLAGRRLKEEHVNAIRHLVASSIPSLEMDQVTVVSNKGRLLSMDTKTAAMRLNDTQFDYTRRIEQTYIDRVEQILAPIVGLDKVRAQIVADMDFTQTEQTQESFNPDLPAVRSEQQLEEQTVGKLDGGVPGALSNEPPGAAAVPEQVAEEGQAAGTVPSKNKSKTTRNYELDKTITHTRKQPGQVQRLSVAVVVDNKEGINEEGEPITIAYTQAELDRFTALVKEAVGFNALRGDTVTVTNAEFTPPKIEPIPEIPLWQRPFVWNLIKQGLGVLLLLIMFFAFVRPMFRNLMLRIKEAKEEAEKPEEPDEDQPRKIKPSGYEDDLQLAKQIATEDPKIVAQVMKSWMMNEKQKGAA